MRASIAFPMIDRLRDGGVLRVSNGADGSFDLSGVTFTAQELDALGREIIAVSRGLGLIADKVSGAALGRYTRADQANVYVPAGGAPSS